MFKLTDEFDNYVVINPKYIVLFRTCNIPNSLNLGTNICMLNGNEYIVKECLNDIRKMLEKFNISIYS